MRPRSNALGIRSLAEGQKISFDIEEDRRTGKSSASNLRASNSDGLPEPEPLFIGG